MRRQRPLLLRMRTCVRPLDDGLIEERSAVEETPQSGLLLTWRKEPTQVPDVTGRTVVCDVSLSCPRVCVCGVAGLAGADADVAIKRSNHFRGTRLCLWLLPHGAAITQDFGAPTLTGPLKVSAFSPIYCFAHAF